MERQNLSSDLIFDKAIIGLVDCLILFFCIKYTLVFPQILFFIPVLGGFTYMIFFLPNHIDYDNQKMYIAKNKVDIEVDLKDISVIKMTSFSVGHRNMWKIKYTCDGEEKAARFFERYFSINLNDFIKMVRAGNPNVDVVYWTWSFDFDI